LWLANEFSDAGRVIEAEAPFPEEAVVEAEIRNSSRPGSQARMRRRVNLRTSW
jgi:hypothetical protein